MYGIEWSKIKNGAVGFENLAREYVKDQYEFFHGKWEKTPQTHDGNKDAYTIIIGFNPDLIDDEVWWMEAKYSNGKKYLSRFRMDATIVSSLFNDKVTKIIFVTNLEIRAKVISDVRVALSIATNCQDVHFCTKNMLEYWLYHHVEIYNKYFRDPMLVNKKMHNLFVSEEISIYSPSNNIGVTESLLNIVSNKVYLAYFKLTSDCSQTIKIRSAQKGVKRISPINVMVQPGENVICVHFIIENKFFESQCKTYDGLTVPNLRLFKVNNELDVMTRKNIKISNNECYQLHIQSQADFRKKFHSQKPKQEAVFWFVSGMSGIGKTTVIEQCIQESRYKFGNNYYFKFTANKYDNLKGVVNVILFLFFPYVYLEEITFNYLNDMDIDNGLKILLINLINKKNSNIELEEYISKLIASNMQFIPPYIDINPRMFFLDDLDLIDNVSLEFLLNIFEQIAQFPVFFVLAGQPTFYEAKAYKDSTKKPMLINYNLELSSADIIRNLNEIFSYQFNIEDGLLNYFFPNLIVFNLYIKYVKDCGDTITDLDSFILNYIYFKKNYTSSQYINRQFNEIFEQFPSAAVLCSKIYNNPSGILVSSNYSREIAILFNYQLIKYDEKNMLVPIHDIYLKHFRQVHQIIMHTDNELSNLQDSLIGLDKLLVNDDIYKKIKTMRYNEKFYSINYILEGIYESPYHEKYQRLWGDDLYYLMFFEYAYAAINCNRQVIGYDCLETIYAGIQGTSSERLMILNLEVIFELINSNYQDGQYQKCREYFDTFEKNINSLIKRGVISSNKMNCLYYVLCTNYLLLIDSEQNVDGILAKAETRKLFLKKNYYHHYIDFLLQFSHTMYISNWQLAYEWSNEAYESLQSAPSSSMKQIHKVKFRHLFMEFLGSEKKRNTICCLKSEMDQMKAEYYSSYRHRNFVYCAILYIIDSVKEADYLLFTDISSSRELRIKMRGYYYQLLALHYLKHNSLEKAKKYLLKSKLYFQLLPSYISIIDHNLELLENSCIKINYAICISSKLDEHTFYIDPRME